MAICGYDELLELFGVAPVERTLLQREDLEAALLTGAKLGHLQGQVSSILDDILRLKGEESSVVERVRQIFCAQDELIQTGRFPGLLIFQEEDFLVPNVEILRSVDWHPLRQANLKLELKLSLLVDL